MDWHEDGWSAGPVNFNKMTGLGNTPFGMEIGYRGAVLSMRPSVFLELAAPLGSPLSTYRGLRKLMANGRTIAMPTLSIMADEDGGYAVEGHDGRHRMRAILDLTGDVEVPVALTVPHSRARHMDAAFLTKISAGLICEDRSRVVDGPLFDRARLSGATVEIERPAPSFSPR